ncbi:MAG: MBL fold metallo-hydrolase [Gemmatimonadota bacterium]|nr:MBL fold metallo-hydrolase [Gemmatimonadota bacterium]
MCLAVAWCALALAPAGSDAAGGPAVEIAPGVFTRNLDPAANQEFVVFDSYVVVFDPGSVVEARNLLAEIQSRIGKPVRYVINSHFHPDHSAGAAMFAAAGAEVVVSEAARPEFENWVPADFAKKVAARPDDYRGLTYAKPTRYLRETWVIDDGVQRLELMHFGPGHTTGDLVGWLPGPRVLFAGDLSTNGQHNLASADLPGWIAVLERLRMLGARQVVPGHKSLAGPELLDKSHQYLRELRTQVAAMVARGMSYEQVMQAVDIPMYEQWSGVSVRNEPTHVRRAYEAAGGTIDEPRPRWSRRRLAAAAGGAGLVMAAGLFLWRRRLRPA